MIIKKGDILFSKFVDSIYVADEAFGPNTVSYLFNGEWTVSSWAIGHDYRGSMDLIEHIDASGPLIEGYCQFCGRE